MPRLALALTLLLLLPCLAGCGEDPAFDGIQVRILTSAMDGPVEGRLVAMALDDGVGATFALEPAGDGLHRAAGAPPGRYRIFSDAGWGMLWTGRKGTAAPLLRGPDYPAALVRMGKPRSLYVAIADPSLPSAPVTARWAAEYKPLDGGDGVPFAPADLEIVDQGEGIVALHFPASQWKGGTALRAVGVMGDGSLSELLSYTVRDTEHFELPRMALVFPAPQAPLTVEVLDPSEPGEPVGAVPVRVRVEGIPLEAEFTQETWKGIAQFDTLPTLGHGVSIRVGGAADGHAFPLDEGTWRRRQIMVVMHPGAHTAEVRLHVGRAGIVEARARVGDATRFALVPFAPETDGTWVLRTAPGPQDLLVLDGDGAWSAFAVDTTSVGPSGTPAAQRVVAPGAPCRVRGSARGLGVGGRVAFTRLMDAVAGADGAPALLPAREAGGHGFEASVTPDGSYELELPAGRYRVQPMGPGGPRGRPRTQTFGPGAVVRMPLSAR